MNVQDALREGADEDGRQQAIEARETDQLHLLLAQHLDDSLVESFAAREYLVIDELDSQAVALGPLERLGLRAIADDDADLRGNLSVLDRIDDRLQVRSASRCEDSQGQGTRHDHPLRVRSERLNR